MSKDALKKGRDKEPVRREVQVEVPGLPDGFRDTHYGNQVHISATAQELFLDLYQLMPKGSGSDEAMFVFVTRLIFPLTLAKTIISQLQDLVERIEKDTGIKLPESEEVD